MKTQKAKRIVQIICLLSLFTVMTGCVKMESTSSTEVGVIVVKWNPFGEQGVIDKVYLEGTSNFFVPFVTKWYTFSSNLQNMEYTINPQRGELEGSDDLLFKTIDGNDIGLDVIISYRIIKEKAPYILKYIASNDEELRTNIVQTISRSKPRDIFGELTTEDFYVTENRDMKSRKAQEKMNELLEPYGVRVEAVGTKDYRFNPAYQKAIEDRKVADQQAEKNKAATRAAEQEYKRKIEEAIGEVNIMKADVDGQFTQGKLEADAYYNAKTQIAKAIETEGVAEAKGIQELNNALTGAGGETLVKMRIADALMGKNILLLPVSGGGLDLKTMDMNKVLEVYGMQKLADTSTDKTDSSGESTQNIIPDTSKPQENTTVSELSKLTDIEGIVKAQ